MSLEEKIQAATREQLEHALETAISKLELDFNFLSSDMEKRNAESTLFAIDRILTAPSP